jgi:K(+)-stimulated pyrophosphate-energized sodium pump
VIADNVGDNVGDCAGMAADLFETYVVTVGATMILTALLIKGVGDLLLPLMALPLLIGGCASSPRSSAPVRAAGRRQEHHGRDVQGLPGHRAAVGPAIWFATQAALGSMEAPIGDQGFTGRTLFYCALVGLAITGLIIWITEYYTGTGYRPVRSIARLRSPGTAPT